MPAKRKVIRVIFATFAALVAVSIWTDGMPVGYLIAWSQGWPTSREEAVSRVLKELSPVQAAQLATDSDTDGSMHQFGLGLFIRNEFGMWGGNVPLMRSTCERQGCPFGPDDASSIILNDVRRTLRELRTAAPYSALERALGE